MEFEALEQTYEEYQAKKKKMKEGNIFDKIFAPSLEDDEGYAAIDNKLELYDPISHGKASIRQMDKLAENWSIAVDSLANGERLPKFN
jgi:hypothetical protein